LLNSTASDSAQSTVQSKRRVLVIGESGAEPLGRQLSESGYEIGAASVESAQPIIADWRPDLAMILLGPASASGENEGVALSRRLREAPATHALPLVLVYGEEERVMRGVALNIGVDDCFGIWTPHEQILARLDALFWRIEAGRRAASMGGDQRLEIDNFIVLLDAVREDIRAGGEGSLALVYAAAGGDNPQLFDKQARDRTLAEAHGFFKLNLRRVDAVGFYGPTTLLIYLPRYNSVDATGVLDKLRAEFLSSRDYCNLAMGVATFPTDTSEVEVLVEKAEEAASRARAAFAAPQLRVEDPPRSETIAPVQALTAAQDSAPAPAAIEASSPPVEEEPAQSSEQLSEDSASAIVHETSSDGDTYAVAPGPTTAQGQTAVRAASDAAAYEREQRSLGAIMPRRLLLTVSDAARMAQLNSLIRSAGYEARTAFDGQQALDLLRIERPDLVLLDYELHGIDGIEMLRRLRKQTGGKLTMPVLMLMSPSQEAARQEALEIGARGVVIMPYDPAELLASVRRAGSVD
jgi:DNA-binding response OmpR family regulator